MTYQTTLLCESFRVSSGRVQIAEFATVRVKSEQPDAVTERGTDVPPVRADAEFLDVSPAVVPFRHVIQKSILRMKRGTVVCGGVVNIFIQVTMASLNIVYAGPLLEKEEWKENFKLG